MLEGGTPKIRNECDTKVPLDTLASIATDQTKASALFDWVAKLQDVAFPRPCNGIEYEVWVVYIPTVKIGYSHIRELIFKITTPVYSACQEGSGLTRIWLYL